MRILTSNLFQRVPIHSLNWPPFRLWRRLRPSADSKFCAWITEHIPCTHKTFMFTLVCCWIYCNTLSNLTLLHPSRLSTSKPLVPIFYIIYIALPPWSSRQSSWLQILDSRRYQIFWEVVGLKQGPLSLVRIIEELLERKNIGSCLGNRN
jgi:hypothetical protein